MLSTPPMQNPKIIDLSRFKSIRALCILDVHMYEGLFPQNLYWLGLLNN